MTEFKIADRLIGKNAPPLVIAEIGINHEGSLELAKTLVDSAKRAGVEVVKHQTHIVEDEMSSTAKKIIPGNANESIYEIINRCALNEAEEYELKQYAEDQGMIFISTPFSRAAADRLGEMDIPAFKIGSGECNNYPLIEHVCQFKKPIILSTGMNNLNSVAKSVEIIRKHNIPFALLHCTSVYPTPYELIRLNGINELHERFPDAVLGLSDHSLSNYPCLGAVALGASILERHYTDHMDRKGPDIPVSMDEKACKELIEGSKIIWQSGGGSKDTLLEEEQVTKDFAYATVVTIKDIAKGEKFSSDNIWVKRPGTGEIKAEYYQDLIGKTAQVEIPIDQHLKKSDVA